MTEREVIEKVKNEYFGEVELDEACIERLELLCKHYGKKGRVAIKLLETVREILEI